MKRSIPRSQARFLKRAESFVQHNLLKEHITTVLRILTTPPRERTSDQVQLLASYMKSIAFFTDLENSMGIDALQQCCQYMTLEQYKEGEVRLVHSSCSMRMMKAPSSMWSC